MTIPTPTAPPSSPPTPRHPRRRQRPNPQRGHRRRLLLPPLRLHASGRPAGHPPRQSPHPHRPHPPPHPDGNRRRPGRRATRWRCSPTAASGRAVVLTPVWLYSRTGTADSAGSRRAGSRRPNQKTGASPARKAPACLASPHPLIPAAPAPPPPRTAESTAAPVPPAPCPPNWAP